MFLLFARQPRPVPLRRLPRAPQLCEDDDGFLGCGWFDSSHDLRLGLLATELQPDDPLPVTLALQGCLAA